MSSIKKSRQNAVNSSENNKGPRIYSITQNSDIESNDISITNSCNTDYKARISKMNDIDAECAFSKRKQQLSILISQQNKRKINKDMSLLSNNKPKKTQTKLNKFPGKSNTKKETFTESKKDKHLTPRFCSSEPTPTLKKIANLMTNADNIQHLLTKANKDNSEQSIVNQEEKLTEELNLINNTLLKLKIKSNRLHRPKLRTNSSFQRILEINNNIRNPSYLIPRSISLDMVSLSPVNCLSQEELMNWNNKYKKNKSCFLNSPICFAKDQSIFGRTQAWLKEKNDKIKTNADHKVEIEMNECTFSPKTLNNPQKKFIQLPSNEFIEANKKLLLNRSLLAKKAKEEELKKIEENKKLIKKSSFVDGAAFYSKNIEWKKQVETQTARKIEGMFPKEVIKNYFIL